jgi:hypothetical protein
MIHVFHYKWAVLQENKYIDIFLHFPTTSFSTNPKTINLVIPLYMAFDKIARDQPFGYCQIKCSEKYHNSNISNNSLNRYSYKLGQKHKNPSPITP